jgi:ABC-type transporter Mla subunit MlaD
MFEIILMVFWVALFAILGVALCGLLTYWVVLYFSAKHDRRE